MRHLWRVLAVLLLLGPAGRAAQAQCANAVQPSCGVYDACFTKYCPCQGQAPEYFQTYGKKYCSSFLQNASFSAAGKKWRDRTLVCLQEKIVPHLDISPTPKCDCAAMRTIAFDSHVACYAQPDASICDLPLADLAEIFKTIDYADLFDREGWKQMLEVANVCLVKAPDDGRRAQWKTAQHKLSNR